MNRRASSILTVGICLLLLTLASPNKGNDAVAGSADEGLMDGGVSPPIAATTPSGCLPRYGEPQFILRVRDADSYEPELTAGDVDGDGLDDVVIRRSRFGTPTTFPLEILLNDGNGSLTVATSSIFSGTVPEVQAPAPPIITDLNRDGFPDFFVSDFGMDAQPHPGYQNTLVLSIPGGKLVDATASLPQQNDNTLQACAADIDGDEDIDLCVSNGWGQNNIDPYILLNDGGGKFSVGLNRLPPLVDLDQNGYTTCEFSDVNNDDSPDLILGDHGDDIANEHSTPDSEVLLNDGTGVFTLLPNAMPPKDVSSFDIGHDIEPINLNDDAYVDLLIVYEGWEGPGEGWQGSYIQALVNNGNGTFRNETLSRLESLDRQVTIPSLELRDLDRDGDLDLLAMPWDADNPDPLLFLNDGNGYFSWTPFDFGLGWSLYYTFLDLDGDGGHDLVFSHVAPPEDIYAIRDLGCPVFLPLICRTR